MRLQNWPKSSIVTSYIYGDLQNHALGDIKANNEDINQGTARASTRAFANQCEKNLRSKTFGVLPAC